MRRAALLLPVALSLACRGARPLPEGEPHQVLEGFALSQSFKGSRSWDLRAQTALLKEDAQQAFLSDPRMEFYRGGKAVSRVTALAGLVHTDTYDLRLTSAVVATSLEDNSVLNTEELEYSSSRKKFFTDKDVVVTKPGGTVHGRGLEATEDLSEIRIFNQKAVLQGRKG